MLYKTHRPNTLEEVFGNKSTIKSLKSLLDKDEPPQVYMLHGPSGTGKTTLARILAYEFGCEEMDIKELNNANFRGIDSSRALIQDSRFKGTKCYILDEAHQLTKDAQDALLKLFEDTPKGSYYILCTTEPTKIKKTIRTRCVDFETKPLSNMDMNRLIDSVLKKEARSLDGEAFDFIIDRAEGSSREALVILETIIDLPKKDQMDALNDYRTAEVKAYDLCRALAKKDLKTCMKMASELTEEPESIRRMILGYYASFFHKQPTEKIRTIIDCFSQNYFDTGKAGLLASIYDYFEG